MNRKNIFRVLAVITCLGFILAVLAGCGGTGNEQTSGDETADVNVSGSILVVGSSALQPLAEAAAQQYTEQNPDATITVQGGGSGNGLTAVSNGSAQIGNSDIYAEEKSGIDASELEDHQVCVIGFAAVVNPQVEVDNLTKQQLIDVFTGQVTNWSEVGGQDLPIVIINRPESSGTRATFKKFGLDGAEEAVGTALQQDSSGAVLQTVAQTEGAISYLALSYVSDTSVKALRLDSVEPTVENITSGAYPIWSYEHMYTKGAAEGLEKAFIDYMMTDEVKPLVEKLGYIPITDMQVSR